MASALLMSPDTTSVPYSRPSTPAIPLRLGFIGIGAMGYQMSRNLAANNHYKPGQPPLLVWNRTKSKCEKLVSEIGESKVAIAQSIEQVVHDCDIIFTNLATDAVVKTIYDQIVKTLQEHPPSRKKTFVETSTIYPHFAGELDALISAVRHARFIACPVFGTPGVADKAQLLIVMSGDYTSKKEVAPFLVPAVGRKIVDLGGNVEKAPTFKLVGNSMILGTIEIMSEAYTLAEKSGIGAESMHTIMKELFPAPGMLAYSDRMARDDFDGTTGFSIDGGLKDASHIRRLTAYYGAPMPSVDIAHQHMITAKAVHSVQKREGKDVVDNLDWTGILAGTRVAAGLDPFDSDKHTGVVVEEE